MILFKSNVSLVCTTEDATQNSLDGEQVDNSKVEANRQMIILKDRILAIGNDY